MKNTREQMSKEAEALSYLAGVIAGRLFDFSTKSGLDGLPIMSAPVKLQRQAGNLAEDLDALAEYLRQ